MAVIRFLYDLYKIYHLFLLKKINENTIYIYIFRAVSFIICNRKS
jgi:hypothetical protein